MARRLPPGRRTKARRLRRSLPLTAALLSGYVLNSISATPKQGRNVVFLGKSAPNGVLTSKGEIYSQGYTPVDLEPTLNIQRSCP